MSDPRAKVIIPPRREKTTDTQRPMDLDKRQLTQRSFAREQRVRDGCKACVEHPGELASRAHIDRDEQLGCVLDENRLEGEVTLKRGRFRDELNNVAVVRWTSSVLPTLFRPSNRGMNRWVLWEAPFWLTISWMKCGGSVVSTSTFSRIRGTRRVGAGRQLPFRVVWKRTTCAIVRIGEGHDALERRNLAQGVCMRWNRVHGARFADEIDTQLHAHSELKNIRQRGHNIRIRQ